MRVLCPNNTKYPSSNSQDILKLTLSTTGRFYRIVEPREVTHLGLLKPGRLGQLIQSTPIPPPPPQPFEWPTIGSQLDTDTWYYYLAETSSRRLVERIKAELYGGKSFAALDV